MSRVSRLADAYERRYPGTGVSEAQAAERMDRITFKEDAAQHRRTGRTRGIIVPALPWMTTTKDGEHEAGVDPPDAERLRGRDG